MSTKSLPVADFRSRIESSAVSESTKQFALELACKDLNMLGTGRRVGAIKRMMGETDRNFIDTSLAIAELIQAELLFEKSNGQTLSFKEQNKPKSAICVYCNRNTKRDRLTRDHVIPRGHGGPDVAANIVWCCERCNQAKANRTPAEWARDILDYGKVRQPLTRLPLSYRVQMAISASIAFVAGLLSIE